MKYPAVDEYQRAVQTPHVAFVDPDLRSATPKLNFSQMPAPYSGGFVVSFCLSTGGKAWCVRCFRRENAELQKRYEATSKFIVSHQKDYLVKSEYQVNGIRINNSLYPITKMDWVDGRPLNSYIESHLADKSLLEKLAEQFRTIILDLRATGVAHGDLQHGNILVNNDRLILVDYDGMYVPALSHLGAGERGHVDYQHPLRNKEFNADLDRFSSIVIYLALRSVTPDLWQKYNNGDNLLFQQDDFRDPDHSSLIRDIEAQERNRELARRFRTICKLPLQKIPTLDEFLSGQLPDTSTVSIELPKRRGQYPVISALNHDEIARHHGDIIVAVGYITAAEEKTVQRGVHQGSPFVFVNFEDWHKKTFRIVVWSECLAQFSSKATDLRTYQNRWISVTGLLQTYADNFGVVPQIELDSPASLIVLANEAEAHSLLRSGSATRSVVEIAQQATAIASSPSSSQSPKSAFTAQKPIEAVKIAEWHKTNNLLVQSSIQASQDLPIKVMPSANNTGTPTWLSNGKLARSQVSGPVTNTPKEESRQPTDSQNSVKAQTKRLPTMAPNHKPTLIDRISAIFSRWFG